MIIVTIYFAGCLLALMLSSMIIECWENNNLYIKTRDDERQAMTSAAVISFGSWLAVVYLLNKNKEEIRWTWRKWTEK